MLKTTNQLLTGASAGDAGDCGGTCKLRVRDPNIWWVGVTRTPAHTRIPRSYGTADSCSANGITYHRFGAA